MTSKIIQLTLIEEYEDAIATSFPKCLCNEGNGVCGHCYYKGKLDELNKELEKDE